MTESKHSMTPAQTLKTRRLKLYARMAGVWMSLLGMALSIAILTKAIPAGDWGPFLIFSSVAGTALLAWRGFLRTSMGLHLRFWLYPVYRDWVAELYQYLSEAVRAELPLHTAVRAWSNDKTPYWLTDRLEALADSLELGESFSNAAAHQPPLFTPESCAVISAGERSGRLAEAFEYVANHSESSGATGFPWILLFSEAGLCFAVAIFNLWKVVPVYEEIFEGMGMDLPSLTVLFIKIARWMRDSWFYLPLILLGLFEIFRLWIRAPALLAWFLTPVPGLETLLWSRPLSRFSFTLSSLLRAQLPLAESVELSVNASNSMALINHKEEIVRALESGVPLPEALRSIRSLPKRFLWYIRAGFLQEHPEDLLESLAVSYQVAYERVAAQAFGILGPLMVVVIGGIIALTVIGSYVPLIRMVEAVAP